MVYWAQFYASLLLAVSFMTPSAPLCLTYVWIQVRPLLLNLHPLGGRSARTREAAVQPFECQHCVMSLASKLTDQSLPASLDDDLAL